MQITNLPHWAYKRAMPSFSPVTFRSRLTPTLQASSCGPSSVANIVAYLSKNGCSRLIPPAGKYEEEYSYLRLIETLTKYMETRKSGTRAINLIYGLEKYVRDRGYSISMEWTGEHYTGKYKQRSTPDLDWIMSKTLGPSNVILWLTFYKYNPRTGSLKNNSSHSVAVAGFNRAYSELFIHDSASDKRKKPICTEAYKFTEGDFYPDEKKRLSTYIRPSELLLSHPYSSIEKLAIIEAALAFEVRPK